MVRRPPPPDCPPTGRAVGVRHPRAAGAGVPVWGPNSVPLACMPCGAACRGGGGGPSPGGVARHRCGGRLVSGAVPPPAARPRGQAAGVPRPVCPRCGRCGRGTQHWPHSVRPCGPALLAVGVAEVLSREGAFHRCEGRLCSGAPPPRTARPLGGLLGSATRMLWAWACWCGCPTLSPWSACSVGAACRGSGGGPSPGWVARHCCEGRLWSGAPPHLDCPPSGRAVGVRHPRAAGAGRWVWGPNTVPLACMPCGSCVPRGWWGAVPRGGGPPPLLGGVWCQALSLPRPPALSGGRPGFRDPCVPGAVGAGVGPSTGPTACALAGRRCSLWGWRKCVPGGVPSTVVRGVCGQALPLPELPAHWAGCWGPRTTCCGRECVCGGAQHCPLGLHALWGLRAVGFVEARPRGGWPATVVRGVWCQALSLPRLPVLWGGQPVFRDPCVPGAVGAGVGPSTGLTVCALAGRRCSLWGWWKGVPGGVPSTIVRGVCGQGLPPPELPTHWVGCWGPPSTCCGRRCVGEGAQHCPLGLHTLWGLRAAGVAGGRPRGWWPATVVGGVWCQALSLPQPPVRWGGQPGFCGPRAPHTVLGGVGTQHRPHSVRPCGPALLAVGLAEERPRGGGALHRCERRLRSRAPPPPTARPLGWPLGSATHVLCTRVCGVGAQHCPLGLHALWGLRAVVVVGGRPWGG